MTKKRRNQNLYNEQAHEMKRRENNNDNRNFITSNRELTNNDNEFSNSIATNFTRYSVNRISLISNMQRQTFPNIFYLDPGDCTYICQYCGAFFFLLNERSNESTVLKFSLCCKNGKIKLPISKETPPILENLLNYYGGPESTYYRKKYSDL